MSGKMNYERLRKSAKPEMTLGQFAAAMKGIGQRRPIRQLLSRLLEALPYDGTTSAQERWIAELAISAMITALNEQGDQPDGLAHNQVPRTGARQTL
jgi:hypothetical protein